VITWSDGVSREGVTFKETILPPSKVEVMKDARLVGLIASDPTSNAPSTGSSSGALKDAKAGGGEARTQTILPEHEKTVHRYFDRKKQ
jgi:hypothetical protein